MEQVFAVCTVRVARQLLFLFFALFSLSLSSTKALINSAPSEAARWHWNHWIACEHLSFFSEKPIEKKNCCACYRSDAEQRFFLFQKFTYFPTNLVLSLCAFMCVCVRPSSVRRTTVVINWIAEIIHLEWEIYENGIEMRLFNVNSELAVFWSNGTNLHIKMVFHSSKCHRSALFCQSKEFLLPHKIWMGIANGTLSCHSTGRQHHTKMMNFCNRLFFYL